MNITAPSLSLAALVLLGAFLHPIAARAQAERPVSPGGPPVPEASAPRPAVRREGPDEAVRDRAPRDRDQDRDRRPEGSVTPRRAGERPPGGEASAPERNREMRQELARVKERLADAMREGRETEARELDREVARLQGRLAESNGSRRGPAGRPARRGSNEPGPSGSPDLAGEAARRLEHLREAIRHLHEGGFPEVARRLEPMAEGLERRVVRRRHPGTGPDEENLRDEVRELRRQVGQLARRLEELAREGGDRR